MCFRAFFSVFGLPFQVKAILHTIMQFSIFHTSRDHRLIYTPPFGAKFFFVFAPVAVFLLNCWLGLSTTVSHEVKRPTW